MSSSLHITTRSIIVNGKLIAAMDLLTYQIKTHTFMCNSILSE